MNKLGRLIKNELLKKIKQPSTIVFASIFIVISFIIPFFNSPITSIDYGYDKWNQIDAEIEHINYALNNIGADVPDYAKGQYTNALEFLNKAKQQNLKSDDWRYQMLFSIYEKVRANYIINLILEDTIDVNNKEEIMHLEDRSGLLYSGQEIDKAQIRATYEANKAQIDNIWQVVENNDYKFYCQKLIESYDIQIKNTEDLIIELKKSIEEKPYDKNLKQELFYSELNLEATKLDKEIAEYRIDSDVPFDNEWRDLTLKKIFEDRGQISNYKSQLFSLNNKSEDDLYQTYGLTKKESITNFEKTIEDYNGRIKISWYSLENDIPHTHNVNDLRTNALNYFSLTMFAAVIAIFIASNIVSGEFSTKTINMLIIRPVKRWKIITAKFIAVFIFAYAIYIAGMIANLISVGITFGFAELSLPFIFISGETVHQMNFLVYMFQNMFFCSVNIVFLVSVVFMMSTLTKNTALSAISGMGAYFIGIILYPILLSTRTPISFLKYTILPYFNLNSFIYINDYYGSIFSLLDDHIKRLLVPEFGAVLFVALSALMFAISLIVFNKRDVK